MERRIYLDTHIVVWLYAGLKEKLSGTAISAIEENQLLYSSFVRLELSYLFETGKVKVAPDVILKGLENDIELVCHDSPLSQLVNNALDHSWTRDPFDRLIVSQAEAEGHRLITKDETILKNFKDAVW